MGVLTTAGAVKVQSYHNYTWTLEIGFLMLRARVQRWSQTKANSTSTERRTDFTSTATPRPLVQRCTARKHTQYTMADDAEHDAAGAGGEEEHANLEETTVDETQLKLPQFQWEAGQEVKSGEEDEDTLYKQCVWIPRRQRDRTGGII